MTSSKETKHKTPSQEVLKKNWVMPSQKEKEGQIPSIVNPEYF